MWCWLRGSGGSARASLHHRLLSAVPPGLLKRHADPSNATATVALCLWGLRSGKPCVWRRSGTQSAEKPELRNRSRLRSGHTGTGIAPRMAISPYPSAKCLARLRWYGQRADARGFRGIKAGSQLRKWGSLGGWCVFLQPVCVLLQAGCASLESVCQFLQPMHLPLLSSRLSLETMCAFLEPECASLETKSLKKGGVSKSLCAGGFCLWGGVLFFSSSAC
jgi:hypothetical protein